MTELRNDTRARYLQAPPLQFVYRASPAPLDIGRGMQGRNTVCAHLPESKSGHIVSAERDRFHLMPAKEKYKEVAQQFVIS